MNVSAEPITNPALLTTPELTQFEHTSTHAEVLSVVNALAASSHLIHREVLLVTQDNKEVPLLVVADPPITSPQQAWESGKTIIYIQGNIHAGEVEGKEASLMLMREIVIGDKRRLLQNQILIFVPIFNADGNDRMAEDSRPSQEGSPKLAGERFSHGMDLNRDGVALETPENKALLANLFNRWDPDVFVDLHTTNGTWHGYSLTYAPSYHTAGEPGTTAFITDKLFPAVTQSMAIKHKLDISWFGDFDANTWPVKEFRTYHHAPRYITNMMGLRNRMAILSETFAHDRFYQRVRTAKAFIEEILLYTNEHAKEIRRTNRAAEQAVVDRIRAQGGKYENGVRYTMIPRDEPLALKAYQHTVVKQKDGSQVVVRGSDIVTLEGVINYNQFAPEMTAIVPKAYVIPQQFSNVIATLRNHGIAVEALTRERSFNGQSFVVESREQQTYQLNSHTNVRLQGSFVAKEKAFKVGDYLVSMDTPLANLIFYLLEPQSDDGLAFWNFFDEHFDANQTQEYPVFKVLLLR
jgi:dipeptidyl-peptidase-4